jgi:hypothetical protein
MDRKTSLNGKETGLNRNGSLGEAMNHEDAIMKFLKIFVL